MLPRIGAILAGFAAFMLVTSAAVFAARTAWPGYAEAEPTRAYSLSMYSARLVAGSFATLVGGAIAVTVDRTAQRAALVFGGVLLVLSVMWHIRIWDQYPVWYHLCWFACIVPCAVLGGILVRRRAAR